MRLFSLSLKSLFIIGLIILAVMGASTLAGFEFIVTNPLACRSCHNYLYDKWEASNVHPKDKTDCEDCHVKRRYPSKPLYVADSEIVNNHCQSCHEDIPEKIGVEKMNLIKISHKRHFNENITCVTCHSNVAHDRDIPSTYRPKKKICLTCHIREIEGSPEDEACTMCHYIILDQRTNLILNR